MLDNSKCIILVPYIHFIEPECDAGLRILEQQGYHVWRAGGFSAIDQGRNVMAQTALDKGYQELMWIDSDVGFQTSDLNRLRKSNLPIAAGVYGLKDGSGRPAAEFYGPVTSYNLTEAKAVGAGFLYTKREVYEKIQTLPGMGKVNGRFTSYHPYFLPMIKDGFYNGEDFAFCERAKQAGYKIMVDPAIKLKHYGRAAHYWEPGINIQPKKVNDLAVVACYFNFAGYQKLKENYYAFKSRLLKQGVDLYTIELAFNDKPFEFTDDGKTTFVRSKDVMWYKENLINMAVKALPPHIKKVIWCDADVYFYDDTWHEKASKLLDVYPIAQMFSVMEDTDAYGKVYEENHCAVKLLESPDMEAEDLSLYRPGFVWGARRDFFEQVGLFDQHIMGSNDSWLCYSAIRKQFPPHFKNLNKSLMNKFYVWEHKLHNYITSPTMVGYLDTRTKHMWHGEKKNRQYAKRQQYIAELNPEEHLHYREDGLLQWNETTSKEMIDNVRDYFLQRKDDANIKIEKENTLGLLTATESKFFATFQQWYKSVIQVWSDPILVYDLGMTEEQVAWCKANGIRLKKFKFNVAGLSKKELFDKFEKRPWELYIWMKPYMIEEAPFNQVIWLDSDTIVLNPLDFIVNKLKKDGFVVFKDKFHPEFTINGDLSKVLPYGSTTSKTLTINAGVMAIDKTVNFQLLTHWTFAVKEALTNPEVYAKVKCMDQGCLAWAMRVMLKDHLMIDDISWNCPANRLTAAQEKITPRTNYKQHSVIEDVRNSHPGINIVHWMGNHKLGKNWADDFTIQLEPKKKMLFVNHEESRTGAPIVLQNVARTVKCHLMNWDITILSKRKGGLTGELNQEFKVKYIDDLVKASISNFDTLLEVARLILKYEQPNFVYANTLESIHYCIAASELGIPSLIHIHELDRNGNFAKMLSGNKVERLKVPGLTYVCACDEIASIYKTRFNLSDEQIVVIHDFCDEARVAKNIKEPPMYDKCNGAIVSCGTADTRKGVDTFVEIAKLMPERSFVWIGKTVNNIGEVPSNVFFTGEVENPHAMLQQCKLFLLTSREDPFPLVVNEAMLLGKPIVAWEGSGGASFMLGTSGCTVKDYTVEAFVEKINSLLNSADLQDVGDKLKERQATYLSQSQKLAEIRRLLQERFNISLAT